MKFIKIGEYLANLQARVWLSRALCLPGQHTAKRQRKCTRQSRKVMAAYRRVYDSRHLQADCQEPGFAPEPYARQSSVGYLACKFAK